jgi:F-type H+-transporting ATPase subunit delta
MKNEVISKRYADAFLEYARGSIGFDEGLRELREMKMVFERNPEITAFADSPQIGYLEKCGFFETVFGGRFSEETITFLKMLLWKRRLDILVDISEYARVAYSHGDEVEALLKTSYPLETDDIKRVKDALEKKFDRKLHLYVELDSDLLGGISVKIENTIIDGSVKRRLSDLREKLIAARVD